MRPVRVLVAAVVVIALAGGCGGASTKPEADLAAQDRLVVMGNQLAAAQARIAAAQRRFARERRAVELTLRKKRPTAPPTPALLRAFGFTLDDLCGRNGRARDKQQPRAQREFERRRKQLLFYLNLSCSPA